MRRINDRVFDIPTQTWTKVIKTCKDRTIGWTFFLLDTNVPISDDYPNRWRNSSEIRAYQPINNLTPGE